MAASDPKKLVEYLLGDLRVLSTEAKKKHTHVKDAAESCLVKIRNINDNSGAHSLLQNVRSACMEILHPLILASSTKNPKLVQIALQAIQHMLQFRVVSADCAPSIVNELWNLTENECEELRVLQTLTPFVSAEVLVTDTSLAKCIGLAIHLNFSKDPSVINAASAAIRQLFSCVFERVIQEDGMKGHSELTIVPQTVRQANPAVPPTLRPCAADAFLLLKDLMALIRKEPPTWLVGVKRISLTLALELLEAILKNYPSIFFKHSEFAALLKNTICPQLVKLFAGERDSLTDSPTQAQTTANRRSMSSLSAASVQSAGQQRPFFSVMMRSIRITYVLISLYHEILMLQTEILLSFLLELLTPEIQEWQPAMALEVVHKLITLMAWFCENYDMQPAGSKLVEAIVSKLKGYVVRLLEHAAIDDSLNERDVSAMRSSQSGFVYNGSFTPLLENLSAKRWVILEWLEKNDPGVVPPGYCLSVAYYSLVDATHSIYAVIEEDSSPTFRRSSSTENELKRKELSAQLFNSAYPSLLSGLTVVLESSIDDSISETTLNCMSTIVVLACKTENTEGRNATLRTICRAVLPHSYFDQHIVAASPATLNGAGGEENGSLPAKAAHSDSHINGEPSQVVAVGTICPTPSLSSAQQNNTVMLTAKNMQVARLLIQCVQSNGQALNESWDVVLTTLQHLFWILGMKPTANGNFRSESSSGDGAPSFGNAATGSTASSTLVTTAFSAELPNLNQQLNRLFESTGEYTDVSLHHVIAALCKLSAEAMMVAQSSQNKEPSFFSVAKLLQTGLCNMKRLTVFWKPICQHTNIPLRDWGAVALTTLVKVGLQSMPLISEHEIDQIKLEQIIFTPLASMSDVEHTDVRSKQLDCLLHILHSDSRQLHSQLWPMIVRIVTSVVESKNTANAQLVDQGFHVVKLIIKEFLSNLPFECVQMVVETDAQYGHQQLNMNISLAAVGLLWDVSDHVSRESKNHEAAQVEQMWLVLYNCLSELCVDPRPPIRKSACDTLLQTVAAHGHLLNTRTWSQLVWKAVQILFPMLEKVRVETRGASTQRTGGAGLGADNIMIHHSRDTESKQWAETTVRTLGGVVKIFNAQRNTLLGLENFASCWKYLLAYIEYVAGTDNTEMSLAALKNFQELLFGRAQAVQSATKGGSRSNVGAQEEAALPLPEKLWIVSWSAWIRVARAVVSPFVPEKSLFNAEVAAEGRTYPKHYIPGSFHFTTLLSAFQPLFFRVSKELDVDESIVSTPLSSEQGPFNINAQNSDISPAQECILDCIYVLYQDELEPNSKLRPAIPDLLRTLLEFVGFSIRPPTSEFQPQAAGRDGQIAWAQQNLISFGELCLRTCVSYYSTVARHAEVIDELVFVDIIKAIAEPLALKYQCPSQSTWKIAAASLMSVCEVGLPIAREKVDHFAPLWPALGNALEDFLFTTSRSEVPLNADERKRHEYVDCQVIDLIRTEILPHAEALPRDFMQHVIDILNRGSINTMDPNDVMALDSFQQRADLSRVCFTALLSLSGASNVADGTANPTGSSPSSRRSSAATALGATAISSLLHRCKQVLNNYARDEQGSGHFRLPQERIFEVISVLRAVSTLIDGLAKRPEAVHSPLYAHLAALHPDLVQLIPSCRSDQQVQLALMTALNAYQTLLLLNIHSK
ncbi:Protein MON2-like protein [Aphelenchoides fujianensis]|nr:Protein MON2-like protein [Aphelenchoides fujianensis]